MAFSSDRANHSLTVAKQMYEKALEKTGDEFYAKKMFHLGLVHDIGYQFTENRKEHAHVGGEFLKEEGYEYWKEVYDHGDPNLTERPSDEWFLLNIADMHTDGKEIELLLMRGLRILEIDMDTSLRNTRWHIH